MKSVIVLVRPENSANIGAVCRAMATADLHDLRIVGKKGDYDESMVVRLALQALPIWESAQFFPATLDGMRASLSDVQIAFGTTRRTGKKRTSRFITAADCVETLFHKNYERAAFVFGNERTGLSDSELAVCNEAVYIPTDKNFGSLNLSHAVQIVCYELFKASINAEQAAAEKSAEISSKGANLAAIYKISETLMSQLSALKFFRNGGYDENYKFFCDILSRAHLSEWEANHIAQLLEKIKAKTNAAEK